MRFTDAELISMVTAPEGDRKTQLGGKGLSAWRGRGLPKWNGSEKCGSREEELQDSLKVKS